MNAKPSKRGKIVTLNDIAKAIQKDIAGLRQDMATKRDLERFATKDDIKQFVTKEDIKNFATKDDLKGFATHTDLISIKEELLEEIGKIKYAREIDELRSRVRKLEQHLGISK